MPAMRLYSPDELESALLEQGCKRLSNDNALVTYWQTINGSTFTVPKADNLSGQYSDWMYDEILELAKDC